MEVRELVTRLGFNVEDRNLRRYSQALNGVTRLATRATAAVTALGAAAGTYAFNNIAQSSSETLSWANRLNVAATELQKLQFAGEKYRVSNEAIRDGLKELQLRTDEFVQTGAGPAIDAFNNLGLSMTELRNRTDEPLELLALVRDRFREVDDAAARQRIADELFGGQAGEQFPEFLRASREEIERMGNRAESIGAVLPPETLERFREFDRTSQTLMSTVRGLGKVAAVAVLPAYQRIAETTQDWLDSNSKLIRSRIERYVEALSDAASNVWSALSAVFSTVDSLVRSFTSWESVIKGIVYLFGALAGMAVFKAILAGAASTIGLFKTLFGWLFSVRAGAVAAAGGVGLLRKGFALLSRIPVIAAIAGLVLGLQDLIVWMQGGDSVIGNMIGSFDEFKKTAGDAIDSVITFFDPLLTAIEGVGDIIEAAFTLNPDKFFEGLDKIGTGLVGWASNIGGLLKDALYAVLPEWFTNALEGVGAGIATAVDAVAEFAGPAEGANPDLGPVPEGVPAALAPRRPSPEDLAGSAGGGGRTQRVEVNARTEATLQVPEGTSDEQRRAIEAQGEEIFAKLWNREIRRGVLDMGSDN